MTLPIDLRGKKSTREPCRFFEIDGCVVLHADVEYPLVTKLLW